MNLFLHDVRVVSCLSHYDRTEGVKYVLLKLSVKTELIRHYLSGSILYYQNCIDFYHCDIIMTMIIIQ